MASRVVMWRSPWPERQGCKGTTVSAPPGYDRYPWAGLGKSDFVVLLDDDPLGATREDGGQAWTCVVPIDHLAFEATVT